jgi:hypothetical protein
VALNFGYLPVFAVRRGCPVESPYVEFAEVAEGNGVVWWRGEPLRWRGWSYFTLKTNVTLSELKLITLYVEFSPAVGRHGGSFFSG